MHNGNLPLRHCSKNGQLARVVRGDQSEAFFWDGLALIHRGETTYMNEPYVAEGF